MCESSQVIEPAFVASYFFCETSWSRVHDILHDMETFSAPLTLWEGNPLVTSGFSSQKTNKAKVWCSRWCWLVQAVKQAITWLGMHKQDNFCSSSMYGCDLPLSGEDAPRRKEVTKRLIFGYFFANERPWCRQFDIDEIETNCVIYKSCLV